MKRLPKSGVVLVQKYPVQAPPLIWVGVSYTSPGPLTVAIACIVVSGEVVQAKHLYMPLLAIQDSMAWFKAIPAIPLAAGNTKAAVWVLKGGFGKAAEIFW